MLARRAEKTFDIADQGRIHLIVDAFNVFNTDSILAQHTVLNSSLNGRVREVQQGRTIRFGVRAVAAGSLSNLMSAALAGLLLTL